MPDTEYSRLFQGDRRAWKAFVLRWNNLKYHPPYPAGTWPTFSREPDRAGRRDADLGERMRQTAVVVMSEFGRRVKENASGGTDHGHGGVMWVLGGGVRGGRVCGDPPDLGTRYGPGDLPVTTDYRTVLAETAMAVLGATDPETLFPGFRFTPIGLFDTA